MSSMTKSHNTEETKTRDIKIKETLRDHKMTPEHGWECVYSAGDHHLFIKHVDDPDVRFEFCCLEHWGEKAFGDDKCYARQFYGLAHMDGIRHLRFGDERPNPEANHCLTYPNIGEVTEVMRALGNMCPNEFNLHSTVHLNG